MIVSINRNLVWPLALTVILLVIYFGALSGFSTEIEDYLSLNPEWTSHPWGLLTYSFVHTYYIHLLANLILMWFAYFLLASKWRIYFIPIFICCGIAGGCAYLILDNADKLMIGASNAIAGIYGSAIIFANGRSYNRYGYRFLASVMLLFALLGGRIEGGVVIGHLGGAVCGIILSGSITIYGKMFRRQSTHKTYHPASPSRSTLKKLRDSGYNSLSTNEKKELGSK